MLCVLFLLVLVMQFVSPEIGNSVTLVLTTFPGISEDGHKEEGRTVEASQGEIWHQHGSTKVNVFCLFLLD